MAPYPPVMCHFCDQEIYMEHYCQRCGGDVDTYHKSEGNIRGVYCVYECSFCDTVIPGTRTLVPHDAHVISSTSDQNNPA